MYIQGTSYISLSCPIVFGNRGCDRIKHTWLDTIAYRAEFKRTFAHIRSNVNFSGVVYIRCMRINDVKLKGFPVGDCYLLNQSEGIPMPNLDLHPGSVFEIDIEWGDYVPIGYIRGLVYNVSILIELGE